MSGLSVPGFQSATGATAAISAQIKKTVGNLAEVAFYSVLVLVIMLLSFYVPA